MHILKRMRTLGLLHPTCVSKIRLNISNNSTLTKHQSCYYYILEQLKTLLIKSATARLRQEYKVFHEKPMKIIIAS